MIRESIDTVVSGQSLTMEEASSVIREIMEGEVTQNFVFAIPSTRLPKVVPEVIGCRASRTTRFGRIT